MGATGFVLDISEDTVNRLKDADETIRKITTASEQASKRVVAAFEQMRTQGVDAFVNSLQNAQSILETLGTKSNGGLGTVITQADKGARAIINMQQALDKTVDNGNGKMTNSAVAKLNVQIEEAYKRLSTLNDVMERGLTNTAGVESEIAQLTQKISMLEYIRDIEIQNMLQKQQNSDLQSDLDKTWYAMEEEKKRIEEENRERERATATEKSQHAKEITQQYIDDDKELRHSNVQRWAEEEKVAYKAAQTKFANMLREEEEIARIEEKKRREAEKTQKAYELAARRAEREEEKRIKTPHELVHWQSQMVTLQQLNWYAKQLKQTIETIDPNTEDFKELSRIFQETKAKINDVKNEINGAEEAQKSWLNTTDQLKRAFTLLFSVSAIKNYINKIVAARKEMELQHRALQVMLGDNNKANEIWNKTVALAVRSPFQVKELVSYTKQLAAYRIESDKLYDTTKRLADVSAGLGVDMQRLILAFGQVKAANYLRGTELRQFSEAGVNMLEELSKYYTEQENRFVSVADVFDRVSKRMVEFKDVEEIFRRITSEGGQFYNMQEEMAATLHGEISNLRDSMTLMLDDIGKQHDGTIKFIVSAIRFLIQNWQMVASVLKLVGGAYALYRINAITSSKATLDFAKNLGVVPKAGKKALSIVRLFVAGVKGIAVAAKAAGAALKAMIANNIWLLAITAVLGALGKLFTWNDEYNAALDEQTQRLGENADAFNRLAKQYDKLSEENARTGSEDNSALIAQLEQMREYVGDNPLEWDVNLETMSKEELDAYAEKIQRRFTASQGIGMDISEAMTDYMTGTEGWFHMFGDNLKTDIKDLDQAVSSVGSAAWRDLDSIAKALDATYGTGFSENVQESTRTLQEFLSLQEQMEEYMNTHGGAKNALDEKSHDKWREFEGNVGKYAVAGDVNELEYELDAVINKLKGKYGDDYFDGLDEELKADWNKQIEDFVASIEGTEMTKGYVNWYLKYKLNLTPTQQKADVEREFTEEWQGIIWDAIQDVQETNPEIRFGLTRDDMFDNNIEGIRTKIANVLPTITTYNNQMATAAAYGVSSQLVWTDDQRKNAQDATAKIENLQKLLSIKPKGGGGGGGGRRKDVVAERIKGQISLIKEMNQAYEKLGEVMTETEAKQRVLESFKETAKTLQLDISKMSFDDKGAIVAYEEMLKRVPKRLRAEVQKALDNYKVELDIEFRKESLEKEVKKVEKAFDQYELSKMIDELGIDSSFMQKYFNVEHIDLSGLRLAIQATKSEFDKYGKEGEDAYAKTLEKVDKLENDAQKERLKKYLKYAKQSIGERAQIKVKELRELAEIEKTFGSEESAEKTAAQKAVKEESYQATKKLDWGEFQKSDMFINLFKDLDMASEKLLEHAIKQLNEFKDNWTDIPLEDMRAIIEKVGELESKLAESSPMKTIRTLRGEGFRTGKKGRENMHELQDEQMRDTQTLNSYESEITLLETLIGLKQEGKDNEAATYALEQERYDLDSMALTQLINRRDAYKDLASKKKKALENTNKEMIKQKQIVAAYQQQEQALGDAQKMAGDLIDAFSDLAEVLGADSDGIGMTFVNMGKSMMDTVLNTIMLQIQLNAATIGANALGVAMNSAMGIVGWIVMAVQLLVAALTAIFQAKDKALEKQIDALAEQTEGLKEKFDDLAESIDEVYSVEGLQKTNEELRKSKKLWIENLEAQKALQEQRKQTDEVKDAIKDLDDQIAEAEEALTEALENSFSHATDGIIDSAIDAAQSFVDAWYEAFQETGEGLKGLEENLDEMLLNMIKKQAAMAIVGKYTDIWKKQLEGLYATDDKLTDEEIKTWAAQIEAALPGISDQLKAFFESFDSVIGGTGSLSGLEEGIAGASEETVQVVAAYLNSIRYFVADNNALIARMRDVIVSDDISVNPMLAQLRIIATNTSDMKRLMESVIHTVGHEKGGAGIKVFI